MEKRFVLGSEFVKAVDDAWIIEGYASTNAVDSYNEIVDPEAFRESLPRFMEFPVTLLNHRWSSTPIGKVIDATIYPQGLWVSVEISKTAPQVWSLINEGILKAFSIGFSGRRIELTNDDTPDVWREIELLEISVVNVPANREALFSVAEERGIDLSPYTTHRTNHHQQKGAGMFEITLDQMKEAVGNEVKGLTPTLEVAASKAAESAVKKPLAEFRSSLDDAGKALTEISESLQNCATKSELKEMEDRVKADVEAVVARHQKPTVRGLNTLEDSLSRSPHYASKGAYFIDASREVNTSPEYIRAVVSTPEELTSNASEQDLVREFHKVNDELLMLMTLARAANPHGFFDARNLKYYGHYAKLRAEYQKAMDTGTSGEGAEWIPTNFASELHDRVEGAAVLASRFETFTMPTKSYTWPIKSTAGTAYLISESTADSATKITATTPATANTTFTAVKLAMRALVSGEFIEDSIIPVLPYLMDDVAKTLARGKEDAIINGDTSATHQDSNVTNAKDVRKAWEGLRYKALNGTAASAATTSATMANIRTIWKLMLQYGNDVSELELVLNIRDLITLMGDSNLHTVANFGDRATAVTGNLASVYGIGITVSPYMQIDLNASGVYDGTTTTKSTMLLVHKPTFMIGDRRLTSVETDKDIETDQMIVVGTTRADFKEFGTGTEPVVIGYNMA